MTFREAADAIVEEQIKAQEAWIEATGDVTDPGELGMLVTLMEALARGNDEDFACEIALLLAIELRKGEEAAASEWGM